MKPDTTEARRIAAQWRLGPVVGHVSGEEAAALVEALADEVDRSASECYTTALHKAAEIETVIPAGEPGRRWRVLIEWLARESMTMPRGGGPTMTDAERLRELAAECSAAAESAGLGDRRGQLRRDSDACERAAQVLDDVQKLPCATCGGTGQGERSSGPDPVDEPCQECSGLGADRIMLDFVLAHGRRMRK